MARESWLRGVHISEGPKEAHRSAAKIA
jgi:hypothetical protein